MEGGISDIIISERPLGEKEQGVFPKEVSTSPVGGKRLETLVRTLVFFNLSHFKKSTTASDIIFEERTFSKFYV